MATFKSTTFGKISGKYGEARATKSKSTGKNYLRVASMPSNPRTNKQVAHRAKFGFVNTTLRAFYPVCKITLGGGNVGIRYAINKAFKEAIIGDYPDFTIDFSKLIFTEGSVYRSDIVYAEKSNETKIKINWDATILTGSNKTEIVNFIFYNEVTNQAMILNSDVQHSVGSILVEVPEIWKAATIHC